ncbi:PQQ-dependent sugar dehydrogenase [Halogeometricum sp. S1BR25-6]|uniref:PQQ-dependent sugar dehydrogenase n=1 Tax=Halogeometricum salsisoli TaxID=2950536 RepID=A0ABU2GDJ1_9EURY|nr:PQQ-dependent sugar dehydrogenase [Halogeometricum sp. S1BR25-6]MDS0298384.1 PQQ-dependent sugar dehydrogenase [Halogeometricum sp. S1BR25-6]
MPPLSRRRALASGLSALLAGVAGCSSAPTNGTDDPPATRTESPPDGDGGGGETGTGTGTGGDGPNLADARVAAESVAAGFVSPVDFFAPAGTDRRFVVDQPGVVYEVTANGRRDAPYLDLREQVVDIGGYDERGLLGVAPHPEFADNGRLYVRYSAPRREGTPRDYSHTFVLSEFTVDPGARTVDGGRERTLLELPEPQSNHNAGSVGFGPDGLLYVGTGDGGGGGDRGTGHVADWYDAVDGGNGQDVTENLLGSILRLDVDSRDGDRPYGIPADNPLVGRDGLDEQYAWGFRNPWRFSFDTRDGNNWDLYVADVGQSEYEEVSVVERGGNYGWNVREGTHCYGAGECPTTTPDGDPLVDPVIEYPHSGDGATGISVIGGYVVRGGALSGTGLAGAYLFADWRSNGRLFAADPASETTPWPVTEVPITGDGAPGSFVTAFGRDGEDLFVLSTGARGLNDRTGALHRLVAP